MNLLKKLWYSFCFILMVLVIYVVYVWFNLPEPRTEPFGSMPSDRYITLTGAKPSDAKVTAYATFYGGGKTCDSISFSASSGKFGHGAKNIIKIEHNYATDANRYEIRIPYREYDEKCHMNIYDFNVESSNEFDDSFAKVIFVRPNQLRTANEIFPITTTFKADNCNAVYNKFLDETRWSGWLDCAISSNRPRSDFNETSILLDFDAFTDSTVITYDIYAGDKYRSTPLDPTKAPE